MRPLPPDDVRYGISRGLADEPPLRRAHRHRLVVELLHLRLDDHLQVGGGLDAAGRVLSDARVPAGVLALQVVRSQVASVLDHGPSIKRAQSTVLEFKVYEGFCCTLLCLWPLFPPNRPTCSEDGACLPPRT